MFEDLKELIKSPKSDEIVRKNLSVPWQADIAVRNKGEEGTCSSNDLKENKEAINVTEQNRNIVLGLTPFVLDGGNHLASQETSRVLVVTQLA